MSDFAERFGFVKPPFDLAPEDMPDTLRAGLWDVVSSHYAQKIAGQSGYNYTPYSQEFDRLTNSIWHSFLRSPMDGKPRGPYEARDLLRKMVLAEFKFYDVYRFIEFLARDLVESESFGPSLIAKKFVKACNRILERERSAFRFAGNLLVMITDSEALREVEDAIVVSPAEGVRIHVRSAAEHYSRDPPDYRNAIKEAISAVEAAVFFVSGKKSSSLASPLREIGAVHALHPALSKGFDALYGYTSDKDGIRHAILSEKAISQAEARYMIVSCAAFANFLVSLKQA